MSKKDAILQNIGAERAVLSGIVTHGSDLLFDVEEVLSTKDFYWEYHQKIYQTLLTLAHQKSAQEFDLPNIQTTAKELGYDDLLSDKRLEYLEAICNKIDLSKNNIKLLAINICKLAVARNAYMTTVHIQKNIKQITGSEDIEKIISMLEDPIYTLTQQAVDSNRSIMKLGSNIDEVITTLLINESKDIVGLSTGFPLWDVAIGGGFRRGTVNVVGARPKNGKCVDSFKTAIITDRGIFMPYEMFNVKCEWEMYHHFDGMLLNEYGKMSRPEYGWANGYKDVVKIKTKYGNTLSATPNHPIKIFNSDGEAIWKNADQLLINDYLICRRGDNCFGTDTANLDEAYVVGLLVGDGHLNNKNCVELSSVDDYCREQFRQFIIRHNGDIGTENRLHIRCNRVSVSEEIFSLGFYDENKYKIFPLKFRKCNKEVVCAMLSGYFDADGTVEKQQISATTNSEKLAIQLRTILFNLNILSQTRIQNIIPPNHTKAKQYWKIFISNTESIRLFKQLIGFKISYKQDELNKLCERSPSTKNDTVPNLGKLLLCLKNKIRNERGYFLSGHRTNLRDNVNRWIRGARRARRDVVQTLLDKLIDFKDLQEYKRIQNIIDPHFFFDKITSLSKEQAWTSDFYIPNGHSFIANNIINHNSYFCLNVAHHMAKNNIPVLYLDTELTQEIQLFRLASLVSKININRIENGQFKNIPQEKDAVLSSQEQIKNLIIDHHSIAGQTTQVILSAARRWLYQKVGIDDNGNIKPCLIIYDYLKLMDDTNLKKIQEYQLIGFLLTHLHNFATKYKIPILATVQLNREGITKENEGAISSSDRILWLCSNFTILKKKRKTDFNDDPPSNGTKKLVVLNTRFGPGVQDNDYINILDNLEIGQLQEGNMHSSNIII